MDNEAASTGNQYDYGFRIYNLRLGKFLSVDPLTKSYPMLTPYQFASNTPIWEVDLDGKKAVIYVWDREWQSKILGAHSAMLGGKATAADLQRTIITILQITKSTQEQCLVVMTLSIAKN